MKFFWIGSPGSETDRTRLMRKAKQILRWLLGTFFVASGIYHFSLGVHEEVMFSALPWSLMLIYLSGAFEIMVGITFFFRPLQVIAAWSAIALLFAVFPAHIHIAIDSDPDAVSWELWGRLPLQLGLIVWAFWYTRSSGKKHIAVARASVNTNAPKAAAATPAHATGDAQGHLKTGAAKPATEGNADAEVDVTSIGRNKGKRKGRKRGRRKTNTEKSKQSEDPG